MIGNHLPTEDFKDVVLYCRFHCLFTTSEQQRLAQLVIWREVGHEHSIYIGALLYRNLEEISHSIIQNVEKFSSKQTLKISVDIYTVLLNKYNFKSFTQLACELGNFKKANLGSIAFFNIESIHVAIMTMICFSIHLYNVHVLIYVFPPPGIFNKKEQRKF